MVVLCFTVLADDETADHNVDAGLDAAARADVHELGAGPAVQVVNFNQTNAGGIILSLENSGVSAGV